MKNVLTLTRVLIECDIETISNGKEKRSIISKILTGALFALVGVILFMVAMLLFLLFYRGYGLLSPYGRESILLQFIVAIGAVLTFVFGFIMIISVFYFSGDLKTLLTLPLKPREIVISKFIATLFYNMATTALVMVPSLLGYGLAGEMGIQYWIMAIMLCLLVPIVPLVYAGVISMFIMLLNRKSSSRDIVTVVASVASIALILVVNSATSKIDYRDEDKLVESIINENESIGKMMNRAFPMLIPGAKAIANLDWAMMGLFLLCIAVIFVVFVLISEVIYFKGAMAVTSGRQKAIKSKAYNVNKAMKSYVIKELKLLFRTPVFFMNFVLLPLVWPLFAGIALIGSVTSGNSTPAAGSDMLVDMGLTDSTVVMALAILATGIVTFLISGINSISGTSISREGKCFNFIKYIPISLKRQINAKVISGFIISTIGSTIYCAIIMLFLGVPVLGILMAVIISVLGNIFFNYFGICIDMIHPYLNWDNESAIKQNLNIIFEIIASYISGVLLTSTGVIFYKLSDNVYLTFAVMAVILAVLSLIAFKIAMNMAVNQIKKIEP